MKRIDALTGLRCIAVGMVVFGHSGPFLPSWAGGRLSPMVLFGHGDMGVHIFFVLSGFLISSLLIREHEKTGRIHFGKFYLRRILRIAPAFYVYMLVLALFATIHVLSISWKQFAVSGLYLWNYAHLLGLDGSFIKYPDGVWYLGHTWSLALEDQFYWMWPALLWFLLRRDIRWLLPGIILTVPLIRMASYFAFPSTRPQLQMMFHTGIDSILVGCFVAINRDMLSARLRRIVGGGPALTVLAAVVLLILPNVTAPLGGTWSITYGRTVEAGLIGLLLLGILAQPDHWLPRMLRLGPLVFVGTISYSLYLWQQFFNHADSPGFFGFPLNIAGALAAATLSYVLVERPFLILKDRRAAATARRPVAVGDTAVSDPGRP